jgi:hypothetical protein
VRLSRQEQETIINFNKAEHIAYIYTCSKSWINHFEKKLGIKPTKTHSHAREYECPKGWIRKPLKPRQVSESQKTKIRQRMPPESILRRETASAVGKTGDENVG